ncbi:SidA/IucD/PvdA family monooxygenase [Pseudomonas gingeri]|uniref:SidA/IucD/PvdA family monooxygenase n=1 Tax=Pseudomonas gingeri TaxID=117681 RepID=UPI0015A378A5|nr:SidA/IucD/PvdA family monooxygenase [Pseudomonas gingeri]NVZ62720.1 SidA/IucD/PvdA family monooxygenase [Pseudomonas gingeri]NVZ77255.1 SidA/IucD/PvdA family monooxygenase [Pseudomonas gingeri]
MSETVYDIVGIGFGPSNLALAIGLEESDSPLSFRFLDAKKQPDWQDEMLLSGSDIQNNPLRDLVTPRNPRSRYGFVNYLKETGRLFDYLNLPLTYPLRREYAEYIKWVAGHFQDSVESSAFAQRVEPLLLKGEHVWKVTYNDHRVIHGRSLVLGTGRTANIPAVFDGLLGPQVFHLNHYLENIHKLPPTAQRIGVIGSSQSAVEIVLDLSARFPDKEIYSLHRSFSFRLKDTSPFSDKVYFPEFVDYYFNLPAEAKARLDKQLRGTNYSSADGDVINALYVRIHEEKLQGRQRIHILNNIAVEQAALGATGQVELALREVNQQQHSTLALDALVLATGFKDIAAKENGELYPPLLEPYHGLFRADADGALVVNRDYSLTALDDYPAVFLNGLCESSHGLGDAGSFSLISLRVEHILSALEGRLAKAPTLHPPAPALA